MATVHPYKGYLTTNFQLYANGSNEVSYQVFDANSDSNEPITIGSFFSNIPQSLKIEEAGTYIIKFNDGTSSEIIVEDGYKFGGSAHKKSFIYDETPWCFVIMNDRTYFYNRETEESYVETISPDAIKLVSSDYILFENDGQPEKTIYSLKEQKPILNVTNIVFYNNDVIIWEEIVEENFIQIAIYSLMDRTILKSIRVNKYVFDDENNSLNYIIDNSLYKQEITLPLKNEQGFRTYGQLISLLYPNIAISIEESYNSSDICIFDTRKGRTVSRLNTQNAIASINSDKLFDIKDHIDILRRFDISIIGCKEALIKAIFNTFTFFPTKWDIYCIIMECIYERGARFSKYNTTYKVKSIINGIEYPLENDITKVVIRDKIICFVNYRESLIFGENISPKYSKNVKVYIHNQDAIQSIGGNIYTLDECYGWKLFNGAKYSLKYFEEYGVIKNEENSTFFNLYGDTMTGYASVSYNPCKHLRIGEKNVFVTGDVLPNLNTSFSKSRKLGLTIDVDGIYLLINDESNIRKNILLDLYDKSSYKSVLLSQDGAHIMFRDDKATVILDVCANTSERYDNVSYIKDINGIRPLFTHRAGSLQPRLVNPVTGQILPHDRMTEFQFVSPNGLLYADTEIDKYIETWNLITNEVVSAAMLSTYYDKYNYVVDSEDEKDKVKEANRRIFIENNLGFFKTMYTEIEICGKDRSDKELIKHLLNLSYTEFLKYFIKRRGIAYIRRKGSNAVVAKIELGNPLWYLNYVSFSYDNRYVAIAGRYPNDSNYGGLFLVYDLINKEEVIAMRNSWAVWLTSFNIKNQVAAYSSEPTSYEAVLTKKDDKTEVSSYEGYSFLTFSPNGVFAALSNQGYVSKYDKYGNERHEWGHMPSCEVFVVKSCDFGKPLFKFSDLSKSGIEGLADKLHNCPKSVTSVSFSNDNKRLMMVGNDGVVIIRNLHLD